MTVLHLPVRAFIIWTFNLDYWVFTSRSDHDLCWRALTDLLVNWNDLWLLVNYQVEGLAAWRTWFASKLSDVLPFTWSALLWPLWASCRLHMLSFTPHARVSLLLCALTGSDCNNGGGICGICPAPAAATPRRYHRIQDIITHPFSQFELINVLGNVQCVSWADAGELRQPRLVSADVSGQVSVL